MNYNLNTPVISVGVITNQNAKTLNVMLEALVPQLKNCVEVIIVVDGPDQDSVEVIKNFRNAQVKCFINELSIGKAESKKKVLSESSGTFILWVDEEDIPLPGLIDTYFGLLIRKPRIDVMYTSLKQYYSAYQKPPSNINTIDIRGLGSGFLEQIFMGKALVCSGSLIRKSLYFESGVIDESLLKDHDLEFSFKIARKARFWKIDKELYIHKRYSGSLSNVINSDYSYISFAIRNFIRRVPLEEIFPAFNWMDIPRALSQALTSIAKSFVYIGDPYNANRFFQCANALHMSCQDLKDFLKVALSLMKYQQVKFILGSTGTMTPSISAEKRTQLRSEVNDYFLIKEKILASYEQGKITESLNHIRKMKEKICPSLMVLEIYLERFKKSGNVLRHKQCLKSCLRMDPYNDLYYKKLLLLAETEFEKKEIRMIRNRMITNNPYSPLYFLSSLESYSINSSICSANYMI
jgi:glycosyltransferase involved in cell wall biosynthesis